jgi:hypothetical protein
MNITRNEKLIKRNSRIAQITMIGGLMVLAAGMFVSFKYPTQVTLSMSALLLGFILSQVGIFYANRWGRHPRPDELLDQALKGMDKKFNLYHYTTPARHVLVGPAGLWILLPYYQRGTITYSKGRWLQKGGNLYLKIFAQEGIGRPDADANAEMSALQRYLEKRLSEENIPPINVALVFTNARVTIDIPEDETPPAQAVLLKDLKEMIRKGGKAKGLTMEKVKLVEDALTAL